MTGFLVDTHVIDKHNPLLLNDFLSFLVLS